MVQCTRTPVKHGVGAEQRGKGKAISAGDNRKNLELANRVSDATLHRCGPAWAVTLVRPSSRVSAYWALFLPPLE